MCTGFEIAALALAAVGTVSTVVAASNQASTSNYNAQVADTQAQQSVQAAAAQEAQKRRDTLRLMSTQEAQLGNSGVTAEGSPLLLFEDTAANAELDAQTIRYDGKIGAARSASSAALSRTQAANTTTGGFISAGSSLLTGVGKAFQPSSSPNAPVTGQPPLSVNTGSTSPGFD